MTRESQRSALWLAVALVVTVQLLFLARPNSLVRHGELESNDGYMRLLRVEVLYETGNWYNPELRRSNTPYGDSPPWTRPLDALLLAGAMPLTPLLGFKTALFRWGVLISPALHVLALLALFWTARSLFDRQGLVCLGAVAITQPALLAYYAAGQPDHHALIGLLFVLVLGSVLRLLARPYTAPAAFGAGVAAAALLWVSVEGLVAIALAFAAPALGWMTAKEDFARKNLVFSAAMTIGLVFALLAERPWDGLGAEVYHQLSLVHVFVFATIAFFWLTASALEQRTTLCDRAGGRAMVALAGAVAAGGAVWLAYPKFFIGPLVDLDSRVLSMWFHGSTELTSIVTPGNPVRSFRNVMFYLGPTLLAAPFLLYLIRRQTGAERRTWMGVAFFLAIFVPLALYQRRWAIYAEFLMVLPYAALVTRALDALDGLPGGGGAAVAATLPSTTRAARSAARTLVVFAFATGALLIAAGMSRLEPDAEMGAAGCPTAAIAMYLGKAYDDMPRRILNIGYIGAEILYRTHHEVVESGALHSTAAILDTHNFFTSTDDRAAWAIVDRRGIDLVLICPFGHEEIRYRGRDGMSTLYERLEQGETPAWLESIALPPHLEHAVRLFAVTR